MRTVIAAAAACVWMSPAMAGAQASDAELTRQGLELRRARRDAQALDTFRRAYAIKPAPRTLAQIALAEQALGRWVQAESDLVKALDFFDDPWMRERRAQLLDGLADIRAHLGWLDVLCDTPGASLWINGEPLGALKGKPVRVEAGTVVLEVRAEGYLSMRRTSAVEAGGVAREDVHLVETAREPVPARPEPQTAGAPASATERDAVAVGRAVRPGDAWLRDAGYVWLGAGALAIGTGTYFGVRTIQEKNDRNQACPDPTFCQTPGG